jgi:LysR family transcriptional regulator, transcriptional activator of the cysJI operon
MAHESLKLFRDIAQTRSFSRGAALNSVSQSAASQQVQELEHELGIELLDRSKRPLVVTAAGHQYAEFCRDVLRRREELNVAIDRMKQEVEGTVRVASIYSVGLSEMVQLEQEFGRRLPEAKLEVEYLRPEKVYWSVLSDAADLGLVSYPEPSREITVLPWRREEMVVAASPYHPLAQGAKVLEVEDLQGVDFIGFDDDLPIARDIDRFLNGQGIKVNITLHFDNIQMIKEAVVHRVGVSIMPARIMKDEISQGRLVAIPIAAPELYRPLGIIHRKKKRFYPVAQAFLELLCEKPTGEFEAV